jgi:acetylornithine deacetylase
MPSRPPERELLARLAAFESVSDRPSRPIADFVCGWLEDAGARIERDETDDGAKVNVLARIGPDVGAEPGGIVLSGHLDVVPADEPQWETDPFALVERDGNWHCRGACDMKGFVALSMRLCADLSSRRLARPLVLLLTADEEVGSLGAQRFVRRLGANARLPRRVVVGEPTSLRVVRMHKGHLKLRVELTGRAAHSGSPHLGRNAIEAAGAVIAGLAAYRAVLESVRTEASAAFADVPYPVLNVARIHGGEAVNVVPDRCVIDVGVRLLPGGASAPVIARVEEIVRRATGALGVTGAVTVVNDSPPMLLPADAAINRELCALVAQTGDHGVSYSSDAGVLRRDLGLECVLFGPGSMEVAHQANEFVPIAEVVRAAEIVRRLVVQECGAA